MASTTPNLGLTVWDSPSDQFNPTQLAANWTALDTALAPKVAPGTEISYQAITADTTTTNAADPGATLYTFSAATYTGAKHYLHIMVPRLSHSVANGTARFRLREGASDVAGIIGAQLATTAGNFSHLNLFVPFTPTAGSHAYTVTWWTTIAGTLTIGATGFSPAILRIIKA